MKPIILGDGVFGTELRIQTEWDYLSRKTHGFNIESINDFFEKLTKYDTVINCIANTKTYDGDRENHWSVNFKFVNYLIDFCNLNNQKLIHISTDYLYSNSKPLASELDVPVHIDSWYGYTKLLGDGLVQLRSNNFLICRLSYKPYPFPYSEAWVDLITNTDYLPTIVNKVKCLIEREATGIFNIGTELKNIYELAIQSKKDVKPIHKPKIVPNDVSMNLEKLNNFLSI